MRDPPLASNSGSATGRSATATTPPEVHGDQPCKVWAPPAWTSPSPQDECPRRSRRPTAVAAAPPTTKPREDRCPGELRGHPGRWSHRARLRPRGRRRCRWRCPVPDQLRGRVTRWPARRCADLWRTGSAARCCHPSPGDRGDAERTQPDARLPVEPISDHDAAGITRVRRHHHPSRQSWRLGHRQLGSGAGRGGGVLPRTRTVAVVGPAHR